MRQNYLLKIAFALFAVGAFAQSNPNCSLLDPIIDTTKVEICAPGSEVELKAETNFGDLIYWYDSQNANHPILKGDKLNLGFVSDSTSYWVSEVIYEEEESDGYAKPTYSGNFAIGFNFGAGLVFQADKHFVINSVEVYPTAPLEGDIGSIKLLDEDDNVLGVVNDIFIPEVQVIGSPTPIVVELNFEVPKPGIYRLVTDSANGVLNPALAVDLPGTQDLDYPYDLGGVAEITSGYQNDDIEDDMYFYFYNWTITIEDVICESNRELITIDVNNEMPELPELESSYVLCGDTGELTLEDVEFDTTTTIKWYDSQGSELPLDTVIEDNKTYYVAAYLKGCISNVKPITLSLTTDISATPTGDSEQNFTSNETLASLDVDGDNLRWYLDYDKEEEVSEDTLLEDGKTYYVTQTLEAHCESMPLGITVTETLGIEDIAFVDFKYTNPVKNILYISNNTKVDNAILYDLTGKRIAVEITHSSDAQLEIDLSHLSSGTYLLDIQAMETNKLVRIIKN